MNTLLRYTEANLVWKMRKLKAYLHSSLTTFCRNFFECNAVKTEKNMSQQQFPIFSPAYSDTWVTRNIHLTYMYSRSMSVKNPEKSSCSKAKVTCTQARQMKQTANYSGHWRRWRGWEEDALFVQGEFGHPNPVVLQRTVWWFLSTHLYVNASVSE